jgi:nucleotide-binding universal stress UspA family protein
MLKKIGTAGCEFARDLMACGLRLRIIGGRKETAGDHAAERKQEAIMYSKILIPLDGSKTAENVLPYARYLARRCKIPVELLCVIDVGEFAAYMPMERTALLEKLIRHETATAESYLHGVADSFRGMDVTCTVRTGRPDEVIVNAAEKHAGILLAMASHGRSGLGRFLLGSVAEKILRGARNPVLLVRAGAGAGANGERELKSVVVPLDGSALAERGVPMAAALAKTLGLEAVLLRAYGVPYVSYVGEDDFTAVNYGEILDAAREEANRYIGKMAAQMKELEVPTVRSAVKEGTPADAIIDFVGESPADLIVMASHGRSGVKRWVLGSVTEAVARHGRAPMLILRPE